VSTHPILAELSQQLLESAHTFQYIQEPAHFEKIAVRARNDIACENLDGHREDNPPAKTILEQSGYQAWLEASKQDERLRALGALRLIADLSEDLAED